MFIYECKITQLWKLAFLLFDLQHVTFQVRNFEDDFGVIASRDNKTQYGFVRNVHVDMNTLTHATVRETMIVISETTNCSSANRQADLIQTVHVVYESFAVEKGAVHDNMDTAKIMCSEPTEESVHHSAGHVGIALFDLHL
ncbi:hypothetical protein D3C80_1789600 [compost metagenome]